MPKNERETYTKEQFDEAVKTAVTAAVTAEVEKTAAKIRADERKKAAEKFADYDALKAKAEGAQTAEDRIAELEKSVATAGHEALRRRVQARHGISDEDADLFLTGTSEDSLTAQAEALAEKAGAAKRSGNRSPREGTPPKAGDADGAEREFVRNLFGRAAAD